MRGIVVAFFFKPKNLQTKQTTNHIVTELCLVYFYFEISNDALGVICSTQNKIKPKIPLLMYQPEFK